MTIEICDEKCNCVLRNYPVPFYDNVDDFLLIASCGIALGVINGKYSVDSACNCLHFE